MPTYAVQADVEAEITTATAARLTTATGSVPDATIIAEQIDLAEVEVNQYLSKRIAVPVDLTEHPDLADWLKGMTLAITVYRLFARRRIPNSVVRDTYHREKEDLQKYVDGELTTPAGETITDTLSEAPVEEWGYQTLKSGRSNMEGL